MTSAAGDNDHIDQAVRERPRLNAADIGANAASEGWKKVEEELEQLDRADLNVNEE